MGVGRAALTEALAAAGDAPGMGKMTARRAGLLVEAVVAISEAALVLLPCCCCSWEEAALLIAPAANTLEREGVDAWPAAGLSADARLLTVRAAMPTSKKAHARIMLPCQNSQHMAPRQKRQTYSRTRSDAIAAHEPTCKLEVKTSMQKVLPNQGVIIHATGRRRRSGRERPARAAHTARRARQARRAYRAHGGRQFRQNRT